MRSLGGVLALLSAASIGLVLSACGGGGGGGNNLTTSPKVTPTVAVTPSAASITTAQALTVTVTVNGSAGTPTGSVTLSSGNYTSSAATLSGGSASISVAAGALAVGSDTLSVSYTPDTSSSSVYYSATGSGSVTVTQAKTTPTVTVTPASSSIAVPQSLQVSISVAGSGATPTGSIVLSSGGYSSASTSLSGGIASIVIPAQSLSAGSATLTAAYTPDANSPTYNSATGTASETVTQYVMPVVTVTPGASILSAVQSLAVTVNVTGATGLATPSGTVMLSSGGYSSSPATLTANGSASFTIGAGVLAAGSDTITATYTPDTAGSTLYSGATGLSSAVTVAANTVSVNQTPTTVAVTNQILGMNMAAWYDIAANKTAIVNAFQTAGIKAVRWPGGSWSDVYHWQTNTNCQTPPYGGGTPSSNDTFANFLTDLAVPAGVDVALTADYGTDPTCTTGGLPSEAAAWVTAAVNAGATVSHMTVGNEEYGAGWEEDLHAKPNDPATYAAAVAGSNGFYSAIKAASSKTLVGVDVDADNKSGGWDATVLANAKGYYDFVEYHFYPQSPGYESDSNLLHNAANDAQALTANLKILQKELTAAGAANTPIYVGEIGSVYSDPGKQSMSITQSLFAGEVLGEMMNDGVSRASWWIGFGGCSGEGSSGAGNYAATLYGWQTYGGYTVFSDGSCPGGPATGTLLPTARAFQLFSQVAVNGEYVLTPTVSGDTTDVIAYAATHNGGTGTALVLFNLNENNSEPVAVGLSSQTSSTDVSVSTYSKALYDQSNGTTPVWAAPTTTDMGAQSLPLTLTLAPWSMNVVLIK
jgi:hypothetical protein